MGIFIRGGRTGGWELSSKKDPRWNCCGTAANVGAFATPREAEEKIKELKKRLGKPPRDLELSCMKD